MDPAVDRLAAVGRLVAAAEDGRIDALCDRLGVRLLGVFGSAARAHRFPEDVPTAPRDVDVAVSFAAQPHLLELIDALVAITDYDGLDVAVIDGADPVLRAAAMVGVPLYERVRGDYATTQMAALGEMRDTAHLRRLDVEALGR